MTRSRWCTRKFETPIERVRPSALHLLERVPRLDVAVLLRHRPVDEVQVDVLEAEPLERRVHRGEGLLRALVVVEQLRRDEELVARDAGVGDRLADAFLVAVDRRGVDVAVADLERVADDPLRLGRVDLEDAEAELGDGVAVVERESGHSCHAQKPRTAQKTSPTRSANRASASTSTRRRVNQSAMLTQSRCRKSSPAGFATASTICGRSITIDAPLVHQQVVRREVAVGEAGAGEGAHDRDHLVEVVAQLGASRHGTCARRGAAWPSVPMNSMSSSVPLTCTGYGTGAPTSYSRLSASNSACAQWPAASVRP